MIDHGGCGNISGRPPRAPPQCRREQASDPDLRLLSVPAASELIPPRAPASEQKPPRWLSRSGRNPPRWRPAKLSRDTEPQTVSMADRNPYRLIGLQGTSGDVQRTRPPRHATGPRGHGRTQDLRLRGTRARLGKPLNSSRWRRIPACIEHPTKLLCVRLRGRRAHTRSRLRRALGDTAAGQRAPRTSLASTPRPPA